MYRSPIVSGSIDAQARFESMRDKKRVFQRHRDLNLEYERRIQSIERETKLIASRIIKIKTEFEGRKKILEEAENQRRPTILPPIVRKEEKKLKWQDKKPNDTKRRQQVRKPVDNSQNKESLSSNKDKISDNAHVPIACRVINTIPEGSECADDEAIDMIATTNGNKAEINVSKEYKDGDLQHSESAKSDNLSHNLPDTTLNTKNVTLTNDKKQSDELKMVDENNNEVKKSQSLLKESKEVIKSSNKYVKLGPIPQRDGQSKGINWITQSDDDEGQIKNPIAVRGQGRRTKRPIIHSGSRRRKRVLLFRIEKMDGEVTYINNVRKPTELERRFFAPHTHFA